MKNVAILALVVFLCAAAACTTDDLPIDPATGPLFASGDTGYCLALGADYTNNVGTLTGIALPSLTVTKDLLHGTASGDPVMRAFGGKIYIVNRTAANVTVIDRATFTVDRQFSTGSGSNPQDIAVANGKGYVAALGLGGVQVWDLDATPAAIAPTTTIDLSTYDPDGIPDASSIAIHGDRAYVTLELLDGQFTPRGKGKVVVIDTGTNAVVDDFDLTFANPFGFLVASGDSLLVETVADYSGVDGCVEAIDTAAPGTGACLAANSAFMGTVSAMAVAGAKTYLAVSAADFSASALHTVSGGTVSAALTPATQAVTDVAVAPSGVLVYSDATGGGIRVYDPARQAEVTTAPLDIGLPPAFAGGIVCEDR
jgi:DNA-binding beta-propeller fold protein YncE